MENGQRALHDGFWVPPKKTIEIESSAIRLRQVLGIHENMFDAEKSLEKLSVYGITLDIVEDNSTELMKGAEAGWDPSAFRMVIRDNVYDGACRGHARSLFTVAHEFGHMYLGHRRTINRSSAINLKPFEHSERQADAFAAEFLMPLSVIKHYGLTTVKEMQKIFGVSTKAATIRLDKLRKRNEI